jgi:molybdopterin/thiamine biosynthesis adenylyltransferase
MKSLGLLNYGDIIFDCSLNSFLSEITVNLDCLLITFLNFDLFHCVSIEFMQIIIVFL